MSASSRASSPGWSGTATNSVVSEREGPPCLPGMTAVPEARAARRTAEMAGTTVHATQADLIRRDKLDSGRATAPLQMADDAHHIDTTPFTLDEVIDQVVALVREATAAVTDGS